MPNIRDFKLTTIRKKKGKNFWDTLNDNTKTLKKNPSVTASKKRPPKKEQLTANSNLETHLKKKDTLTKSDKKVRVKSKNKPNETRAKLEPNWSQTGAKLEPNWSQTRANLETELEPQLEPNWSQIGAKLEPNKTTSKIAEIGYLGLSGLQRKLTLHIYEICKLSRNKYTIPLSIEDFVTHCCTTISATKKALQRLEKKHIVSRKQFKSGRSGWTIYELNQKIFLEILHRENHLNKVRHGAKLEPNWSQTGANLETELGTELEPNLSSSSSININTTTERDLASITTENDWINIDHGPIEPFGFTQNHVAQIEKKNITTPELLQSSIEHFAFDLKENDKAKTINKSPLQFFMGIMLRQGAYHAPKNYESPKNKVMRIVLEDKMREQAAFENMQEKFITVEKQAWLNKLMPEELEALLPKNQNSILRVAGAKKAIISQYFRENIWPEKKKKYPELFEKQD